MWEPQQSFSRKLKRSIWGSRLSTEADVTFCVEIHGGMGGSIGENARTESWGKDRSENGAMLHELHWTNWLYSSKNGMVL